MTAPIPVKS